MTQRSTAALRGFEVLDRTLPGWLPVFLPPRRWFGAKSRAIERAALLDAAWLDDRAEGPALAMVEVHYTSGPPDRYTLLVAWTAEPGREAALGRAEVGDGVRTLIECADRPDSAWALLRHLGAERTIETMRGGGLRYGDVPPPAVPALGLPAPDAGAVRPLGAEQSNTSLRIGAERVFKLFRRLETGEHPELEVGRFLARRTSFRDAPMLFGSLTWRAADGNEATVGVLQDFVASRGDGWSWTLERLRARPAADDPALLEAFRDLGATTAALHTALASDPSAPGFAPEPATRRDLDLWRAAQADRAREVCALLEARLDGLPKAAAADARATLARRDELAAPALPDPDGDAGFARIRIHGDYHLGQTLRTDSGFVLLDFEGEPARPLAERRTTHCALRDVAGMLRSFDYAAAEARGGDPDSVRWLRRTFLDGYRDTAGDGAFLPRSSEAAAALLAFFERDKALYEIAYELNHRPDWVGIPLRGLNALLEGGPA